MKCSGPNVDSAVRMVQREPHYSDNPVKDELQVCDETRSSLSGTRVETTGRTMGHRFDFWRVLWCGEWTAHRRTLWSNQVAAELYVRRVNRIRRIGLLVWSLQLW